MFFQLDRVWQQVQKIVAFDREYLDKFGHVSMSGDFIFVGALYDDNVLGSKILTDVGAVYIFELTNTGISQNSFDLELNLYPNPTSGIVTIELGKTYKSLNLIVTNVIGQVVLSKKYKSTNKLNFKISGSPGFYFVVLQSSCGEKSILKVIKE